MVPVFSLMIARYCAIITGKAADQTTRSGSNGDDDDGGNILVRVMAVVAIMMKRI